ncbi:alpha/beta hydrolase-fold protein [Chitinophaga horti]|uniref:Alpha/beta hydrolase-fold protein n=1 Tax=Chitinophaga horti TaxID=2920382 RepID=A0ABY6IX61_9BACT|nr:PHB depolymerase family esterase [Chitinophaga horti]UYQ91973.1 alpha/beta hydrolase-fold protein [Chitinophaga horti]
MKMIFSFFSVCICLSLFSCEKKDDDSRRHRFTEQVMIDGLRRTYVVKLPRNYYEQDSARALVIGIHGTGGSADQFEKAYGFNQLASEKGFIMVYPDGVEKQDGAGILRVRTWNAGTCCDYAMYTNVNDVKFISTLIDEVSSRFLVNRKKVYVAGMSNGGMLAYRLASELPGKLAAAGIVSGTMVAPKDTTLKGVVPLIHIHALPDQKVPVHAGGAGIGNYVFPPAVEGINYWVKRNQCATEPAVEQRQGYEITSWKNAAGVVVMQRYLTQDGGHAWPSAPPQGRRGDTPSKVINATHLIWDFCDRFSLP